MDASELTQQQIDALTWRLRPMIQFLQRLKSRMDARGFAADDPLRVAVEGTLARLEELSATLRGLAIARVQYDDYFADFSPRKHRQKRKRR
jgi:hypothetical protein